MTSRSSKRAEKIEEAVEARRGGSLCRHCHDPVQYVARTIMGDAETWDALNPDGTAHECKGMED